MRLALLAVVLVVSVVSGCASPKQEETAVVQVPMAPTNATIIVGNLGHQLKPGDTISWFNEDFIDLEDATFMTDAEKIELESALKGYFEAAFAEKGISFAKAPGSTRFQLLIAGAATPKKMTELHSLFKVYPGLLGHDMQTASLMVSVMDSARSMSVWRAVVEGQFEADLTMDQRLQNLEQTVTSLIEPLEI